MKHLPSILLSTLTMLIVTSTSFAQTPENRWLRPEGGNLDDPANWSFQEIPGPFDTAVFEVGGSQPYTVFGTSGQIGGIEIGGDEVDARFSGVGQVLFAEFLGVGGRSSNSDFRPGRLRLELDPGSPAFLSFIEIGKQGFASQFTLAPSSRIGTLFFDLRPSASIRFELDQESGGSQSEPVLLAKKGASFAGTIEIVRQSNALLPPLGTVIDLFSSPSGIGTASIPAIVTAAQPGRRIAPEFIDSNGDGVPDRLIGTVRAAETTNVVEEVESLEIGAATFAIEAADLDGDGVDEIVIATEAGKLRIYQPTASGGFAGPFDYVVGSIPVDIASGDYDGDGTVDLAIANFGDDDLSILLNPDDDPDALVAAENLSVPAGPASIVTTDLGAAEGNLLADSADLFVVSRSSGTATGYKSRGNGTFEKVSEVEVGEEPGPSAPIDDENKKDPDPPVGVGGTASGLVGTS
ncbi:MAG: VCBS repeat-containing protein, partial [Phycisphaera sp.]|nr:VCBS repeat-containing protein [Phycisphaera sp.]